MYCSPWLSSLSVQDQVWMCPGVVLVHPEFTLGCAELPLWGVSRVPQASRHVTMHRLNARRIHPAVISEIRADAEENGYKSTPSGSKGLSPDQHCSYPMRFTLLSLAASALSASAASLQQINGITPNPNNVTFYSYVPASLAVPPPLILALHYCTGTAQAYYSGTQYASLADQHGYIVIYPSGECQNFLHPNLRISASMSPSTSLIWIPFSISAPREGGCWDVNTQATLTHNGGSDSIAMAAAVTYAIKTWGVDANRVYVTGTSSGAMMTNVSDESKLQSLFVSSF